MNGADVRHEGEAAVGRLRRRFVLAGLLAPVAGSFSGVVSAAAAKEQARWLPAFTAPLHAPAEDGSPHSDAALRFENLSLRQFVPLALTGDAFRLRLSNEFGERPLQIEAVHLAWRAARNGAAVLAGSGRRVSFKGRSAARLMPGRTGLSDPVRLPLPARTADGELPDLAVSLYLRQPSPRASWHLVGSRTGYRSVPGDHNRALDFPVAAFDRSIFFLAAVEAHAPAGASVWVAFGDSITDGNGQTPDSVGSWPAQWGAAWARRTAKGPPVGVLNAGVSGNRLLAGLQGLTGLGRFERDVLALPGAAGVVLLIGINDLSTTRTPASAVEMADRLIGGQTELLRRARARGLRVVGATLTPVGGSAYGRPEVEAGRQHLNRWIRETAPFDTVVDFDAAVRDPLDPTVFRRGWSSDGLHPNDAGYRGMADAVVQALDRAGLAPRVP